MGPPALENRMKAPAEAARDVAEAQRRAQKRAAQRTPLVVVKPLPAVWIVEREGEAGGARNVNARSQDATETSLPLRRLEPLDQDVDAIAGAQIAREVHLPVVHVGDRPGERDALTDGEKGIGDRGVQRIVEIRLNDRGGAESLGRPGDGFDALAPARVAAEARHHQMPLGIEAHAQAIGDRRAFQPAHLEDQSRLHTAGVQRVLRLEEADVLTAGDAGAHEHIGQHLAAAEGVGPFVVRTRHHDGERDRDLARRPRLVCGPHQHPGSERAGSNVVTRSPGPNHQSICLRMKVGISISFSSGLPGGGACAGRLGAPPTSAGFANPGGGTCVGRAPRSRNGSTPAAGRCTPASASAMAPVLSNPVAITVIRTSPCIAGSFTAPKMISASSPAASSIASLICVTSPSVRSSPPVMLISTPVAPAIEMLSSSGLEIACCAASIARFSPRPCPVPINPAPPFCMTVRTSAKSTLTRPVTQMRAEMPCVACNSTSSAFFSASWNGMPFPTTASSRSLGTTIIVSTCLRISAMPISAWRIRLRPSNRNGLVQIPMVRPPRSRATCEMIGAAPVPVPPPMPQVTNTRSALCRACSTSSRFSSIACRPISGRAPAPSPRVKRLPIWTLTSALLLRSAWASVFTAMNSTPRTPSSIMRFRALPPPPPTPTTFIRAFCDTVSSSSKIMVPSGDRSEEVLQPPLQR